jgi:hypothetical protein
MVMEAVLVLDSITELGIMWCNVMCYAFLYVWCELLPKE